MSSRRTGVLALAATALIAGPPLYWVTSADGATPPVGTLASKDPAAPGDCPPEDGPSGNDGDGTTAPGMTTTANDKDTSNGEGVTSAPGVTTAPGGTSAGGKTADKGSADTTIGQDTSTQGGQLTSDAGHDTGTTAGETNQTGPGCQPTVAPPVTPPEQPPVTPPAQPPAVTPPGVTPPGLAPAPPPGAPPPPEQQPGRFGVLPARTVSPAATLRAASGCPAQVFFARVSGRAIARVTFTVDGKRVATLTRPDRTGVWKYRVDPRNYSVGKHRIVARVRFERDNSKIGLRQANGNVVKTLTTTFSRCARKASRPTFTG